ncbi:MAG: arginine--tRNA ligase [Clostridia bacterium]|nr:arginine--tRNA ligase [Clostridia bacterium]
MMNIINSIELSIKKITENSIRKCMTEKLIPEFEIDDINVEKPREKEHGEFSTNIAMMMVKKAKMAPVKIASMLVDNMDFKNTYILKAETAGPGFINFYLSDQWLYDNTEMIIKQKDNYGSSDYGKNEKVVVEYVSANPTGPLHMGNARGGALGDLLANVLIKAGYHVSKEFYVNDAGNQIEKFGLSLEARYLQELLGEDKVKFDEDLYQGADIIDHVKNYIKEGRENLLDKDSEDRKKILVDYALPKNIRAIKKGLKRYGISYDKWFSEKSLYESKAVDELIDYLVKHNHTFIKDEALWLKGESIGSEKDEVLTRSNGFPTYFAADIAYHWNKFKTRKFDRAINLLGVDHHGHVARMKGAMNAIGVGEEKLDIIIFQLVRLYRNGEVARMSKRTGKAISLDDLLDEVGVDAARFFFNLKTSGSHLDFDLDLAKKQSNENPVFYVQYAYARICSMLRILKEDDADIDKEEGIDYSLLKNNEEIELMKKLAEYPNDIIISCHTLEPSRMTRYVLDLASLFHSFYNACRVKGENEELLYARMALVKATKIVLKNALDILSIKAPEKM